MKSMTPQYHEFGISSFLQLTNDDSFSEYLQLINIPLYKESVTDFYTFDRMWDEE